MTASIKNTWSPYGTLTDTIASASLDSLPCKDINEEGTVLGVPIFNGSDRNMYIKFEVDLTQADLSAQSEPEVNLYLVESLDGINYGDANPLTSKHLAQVPIEATDAPYQGTPSNTVCSVRRAK